MMVLIQRILPLLLLALCVISCGSKEARTPRQPKRENEETVKQIQLVGPSERKSYLEATAQEVSSMVRSGASVADISAKLASVCEGFVEKYSSKMANGEELLPECKSEGDLALDISSFNLFQFLGSSADDLSLVTDGMRAGGVEIVRMLLGYRYFNVRSADKDGKTLAMHAAELAQLDTFLFLVSIEVDLLAKDRNGCDVVCWARQGNGASDANFVAKISEEAGIAARNIPELTRMLLAQAQNTRVNRNYELIARTVAAGANINATNGEGVAIVVGFIKSFDIRSLSRLSQHKDEKGEYDLDLSLKVRRKNLRQYAEWAAQYPPSDVSAEEIQQVIALLRELEIAGRIPTTN